MFCPCVLCVNVIRSYVPYVMQRWCCFSDLENFEENFGIPFAPQVHTLQYHLFVAELIQKIARSLWGYSPWHICDPNSHLPSQVSELSLWGLKCQLLISFYKFNLPFLFLHRNFYDTTSVGRVRPCCLHSYSNASVSQAASAGAHDSKHWFY